MYSSSRTAVALMAVAATMPFTISSAQAGEGYSGMSGLAQREIIRRQEAVAEADRLFLEGREAYAKADYQQSVDKYRQALSTLPEAPTLSDRRQSYTEHLGDASVALAQQFRKVGKYDEARQLLDGVLAPDVDPENIAAKTELGYLDDPIRTNPALTYEHTKNVDEVRRGIYMAQGNFDLGKYDAAKKDYENVLRIDPYNTAARRGMEKIAAAKSDYYRAAYDQTRAELLMQVDQAWELSVPAELPNFGPGTNNDNQPSDGVAYITEKLRRIVIPRIDFEDTTVEEAIDFLRLRAAELDTLELDPAKKGVNFVIRRPRNNAVGGGDSGLDAATGDAPLLGGGDPGALRINELRLRNVPLAVALKYIGDATKLRYKVDDFAVTLVPQTETGEDLFTRTFRVPPDFASMLNSGGNAGGGGGDVDPFADAGGGTGGSLQARPPIIELLKQSGIDFADGSSATLGAGGSLLVTNTPSELDKVEQLVDAFANQQPKQVKITTKFVEISQENNDELGFDWIVTPFGLSANSVFGSGGTVGNGGARTGADFVSPINGTSIPGIPAGTDQVSNIVTSGLRSGDQAINRNNIDAILNNPSRTAQTANVAPGILGLTGLFSDGQVQVIMRGLAQKKGTDLMTAPSVTARSGQKATIEVIREFIYPTEYEPPELPNSVGTSSGNGLLGGTTGSSSGSFPVTPATPTAFETKNTGVTLEIEPTIGENDFVIDLRFLPEIVEFEGFINYGSPILSPSTDLFGNAVNAVITENRIEMPVFSKRSVSTSLTIYDGYTVAVGGLMREDVQNVEDKVPILGDIPVIGRLFQTKGENRIKSNLIIFVTAQIIDATGRPLRGADAAGSVPVSTGDLGEGVLPPLDLPE
ncbi:Amuc_1098 family type IV pilus outer membrane protein [Luteolibacter algae]|uniref:Amuc_1098 family type IV pilus outer membrane protein n=1 Tax=Luteolibacter algae TaxID=454151 RepID=A0ABW5DBI7_9BACT